MESDTEVQVTACNGKKIPLSDLDIGIREVVRRLVMAGFETIDSGDGRSKSEEERWEEVPHVKMRVPLDKMVSEAERLKALVDGWPLRSVPDPKAPPELLDKTPREAVHISVVYEPGRDFAMLGLYCLSDANLADFEQPEDVAAKERLAALEPWLGSLRPGDVCRLYGWEGPHFTTVRSVTADLYKGPQVETVPDVPMHQLLPLKPEDEEVVRVMLEMTIARMRGTNLAMRARLAQYIDFGIDEWAERLAPPKLQPLPSDLTIGEPQRVTVTDAWALALQQGQDTNKGDG